MRGADSELADPTWYRVRYSLATQYLRMATGDGADGSAGWPQGITARPDDDWAQTFGLQTASLVSDLYRDRESAGSYLNEPAEAAELEAWGLLMSTSHVLEGAGWHWVGRRPPRYLLWAKRRSVPSVRRRPPGSERELARFLSRTVEPASAVLLCSVWVVTKREQIYERIVEYVEHPGEGVPAPLKRSLRWGDLEDWTLQYLERLLADEQVDTRIRARWRATLGLTRLREPATPNFRVRYNLACLFSRLAAVASSRRQEQICDRLLEVAMLQLDAALWSLPNSYQRRMASWAQTDPALEELRTHDPPAFAAIVATWAPRDRKKAERLSIDSEAIKGIAFDERKQILEVEFSEGARYHYLNVPREVFEQFGKAESAGTFFNERVKKEFVHVRLA